MEQRPEYIAGLITAYIKNDLDEAGRAQLDAWAAASEENKLLFEQLTDESYLSGLVQAGQQLDSEAMLKRIRRGRVVEMGTFHWRRYAAAAVLLLVAGGAYLWKHGAKKDIAGIATVVGKADVAPGREGAILTLADGKTIVLDSAANGSLAVQGNTKVVKLDNGQLTYTTGRMGSPAGEVLYNELYTPRGRQFQVSLPDGSHAWLNAASSIRYPTAFIGKERIVEITGEAYFEVAHDASRPFHVKVGGMDVQVLGTHFNVNAYQDEQEVKTTLLEGKVKITKGAVITILKPGQQAAVTKTDQLKVLSDADLDETIAWKNGYFQFKKEGIETIMRQVSRWYDVDIQYMGEPVVDEFYSEIPRSSNVSAVFEALQAAGGVHFKIDGKKIIVSR